MGIKPIDYYVIDSLLKENKITSNVLLPIIAKYTQPTEFCNELVTAVHKNTNAPNKSILLKDWGISKLECARILKHHLSLDLKTAKDTVDSLPTIIDVSHLTENEISKMLSELGKNKCVFVNNKF